MRVLWLISVTIALWSERRIWRKHLVVRD